VYNTVAEGVATGSCEGDYRLLLTLQELRSIVGDDACARVLTALETDEPDAIALRRTTASGRWINFHTDKATRTVQVGSCSSSATAQAPAVRCGLVHGMSDAWLLRRFRSLTTARARAVCCSSHAPMAA
jgi:hypothetical protein